MTFPAARPFCDLRPFVFRYHALKLKQQMLFRGGCMGRLYKDNVNGMLGKFLYQQNLVRVLATQTVRRVDQYMLNLAFGSQIAQLLEPWAAQLGAAVTFVFENPFSGNRVAFLMGVFDQRGNLARNSLFFLLPLRRDPCVNRSCPHFPLRPALPLPLLRKSPCARFSREQEAGMPCRSSELTVGQSNIPGQSLALPLAACPRPRPLKRNASKA
jgi:hypothetical protein